VEKVNTSFEVKKILTTEESSFEKCQQMFQVFALWFLKDRYFRHIVHDGKMADKKEYLKVKNDLISMILNK
jgi:hypothetical protein